MRWLDTLSAFFARPSEETVGEVSEGAYRNC